MVVPCAHLLPSTTLLALEELVDRTDVTAWVVSPTAPDTAPAGAAWTALPALLVAYLGLNPAPRGLLLAGCGTTVE